MQLIVVLNAVRHAIISLTRVDLLSVVIVATHSLHLAIGRRHHVRHITVVTLIRGAHSRAYIRIQIRIALSVVTIVIHACLLACR